LCYLISGCFFSGCTCKRQAHAEAGKTGGRLPTGYFHENSFGIWVGFIALHLIPFLGSVGRSEQETYKINLKKNVEKNDSSCLYYIVLKIEL
jgi:hypothetical protein